ncbi:MAG TPA: MBOAT family protein [Phycisphaerae bacterium]|nr:MBOAT family protein [Phycisphaerae bacterium]HNU47172.1 MBOAT family protein [Phycisphaerae bacterium]
MLFNSAAFAVFLPVMLTAYWLLRGGSRKWALLAGSYFFYSWWDWRFTSLLMISTVLDYCCGRALERCPQRRWRRAVLSASICGNLGILGTFKYFSFFRDSAAALLGTVGWHPDWPTLHIILPMGISFYTFQTMSYTIDVYRGVIPAERNLRNFACFVACFPQLVAGPIVRAGHLLPQLQAQQRFADVDWTTGVYRLFRGLFKKMVVADLLALHVDAVFADPAGYSGISCWLALYAYAFQIYMDFSGYTDAALGTGEMLGLKFVENFDHPYLAASPAEFWRRWHISLSTWLRDYLYIPLGGSRFGRWLTMRNLFLTMALGGLWHGAAWTFVAWGVYHGILLAAQRLLHGGPRPAAAGDTPLPYRILKIAGMFHLSCLGWLLFRAPDWATVQIMLGKLFTLADGELRGKRFALIILACMVAHFRPGWSRISAYLPRVPALAQGALAGLCLWTLLLLSPGAKPFIYFQF